MEFQEFTFVEPNTGLEYMIDIDVDTHKIIDCYGYINDVKEEKDGEWSDELSKLLNIRLKVGQNPLFGHTRSFKTIFAYCVVSTDNVDDYEFLYEVVIKNKITNYEILEP